MDTTLRLLSWIEDEVNRLRQEALKEHRNADADRITEGYLKDIHGTLLQLVDSYKNAIEQLKQKQASF